MPNELLVGDSQEKYAREIVAQFADEIWRSRSLQISQMLLMAEMPHLLMQAGIHQPVGEQWLTYGLETQQWLLMARAGLGLVETPADPEDAAMLRGEVYECCQALAEWLFAIPGMSTYHIPAIWAEHPMGELWHLAMIWVAGDELITIAEAAKIAGVSTQAIHGRIARGSMKAYIDPHAPQHQGRRRVRRSEATAT